MAEKSGQALTLLLPGRSDQTATVVLEQFLPKVLGQSRTCDAHRTVPYSCAARPDLGSRTYGRTALGGRRPDLGDAQQIGRARLTKRHPSGDRDLIAYLPEPFFQCRAASCCHHRIHIMHVRADHVARAVENGVYFVRGNNVVLGKDPAITKFDGVGYGDSYIVDPYGEIVVRSRRHSPSHARVNLS